MPRIGAYLGQNPQPFLMRPLTKADDPLCRRLSEAASRSALSSAAVSEPMLTTLLAQQLRAQQIGYRQAYPDAEYFAVVVDGVAVGRVVVAIVERACAEATGAGVDISALQPCGRTLHIIEIALLPSAQGRGIGSAAIASLAKVARELGAGRLTLTVQCSNDRARRLYARLGFVETGGEALLDMAMALP